MDRERILQFGKPIPYLAFPVNVSSASSQVNIDEERTQVNTETTVALYSLISQTQGLVKNQLSGRSSQRFSASMRSRFASIEPGVSFPSSSNRVGGGRRNIGGEEG